jgi:hypothetical protein
MRKVSFVYLVFLPLLVGALWVRPVFSQETKKKAEALAKAGELLFDAKKFKDALKQFMDAYALFEPPKFVIPEVIWNIGRCYEEMGDDVNALKFFEEFERYAKDPQYKGAAQAKIKEVKGRIRAFIEITVDEEGAEVILDGEMIGLSPLEAPLKVTPGKHVLVVQKTGFPQFESTVDVAIGEKKRVDVVLADVDGFVRIVASGNLTGQAKVAVDDKQVYEGVLPTSVKVQPGSHRVRVEGLQNADVVDKVIEVGKKETVEVVVIAKKEVLPPPTGIAKKPEESKTLPGPAVTKKVEAKKKFPWHFVVMGGGGALVIVGGVMNALAKKDASKIDSANKAPDGTVIGMTRQEALDLQSSADTKKKTAYAFYGIGAATIAGGTAWWLVTYFKGKKHASMPVMLSFEPTPGGGLFGAQCEF